MTKKQLSSLAEVLEKWVNENCEDFDTYWPDNMGDRLAEACEIVIDAMVDSYAKSEEG